MLLNTEKLLQSDFPTPRDHAGRDTRQGTESLIYLTAINRRANDHPKRALEARKSDENTYDTQQTWFFKFYLEVHGFEKENFILFRANFRAFELSSHSLVYTVHTGDPK